VPNYPAIAVKSKAEADLGETVSVIVTIVAEKNGEPRHAINDLTAQMSSK
jgi:hypothetical protein